MKYNLSKIMKNAWELVKGFGMSISEGLKKAWRFAKEESNKKAKKRSRKSDKNWFFGDDLKMVSNKYFTFNRVIDDDNVIVITNNIKVIKNNYVLLVDNNKAVYLKDWQVRKVHNFFEGLTAYAVKLNRNYFKPYTFRFDFDGYSFEKEQTFDDMVEVAKDQQAKNFKIAIGGMNC